MLQFITHTSELYSIVEQVKMVLEGGCKWIQLRMKEATDEEVKAVAEELIPLCKEADAILVIDDRVELVKEMEVTGVHLGKKDMPVAEARNLLEGGPIIGATANTAGDIFALKGIDVDYVGLGPFRHTTTKENLSPILGLEGYSKIMKEIREAGVQLPVVAIGGITLEDIDDVVATGVNGVAISGAIINAENPVEYTKAILNKLYNN
ncbi:MAG: thiamine phosphate synthase [Muribaculaceae bacterium]|nr:thiamine phosphate synthase [Muribaculaceae bacterium]